MTASPPPGFRAGAAAAVHDQFNTDQTGFSLVVQSAQTGSAVAAVVSVSALTGAMPFVNIVANTYAGSVTFLKIVADYKADGKFNKGDVVSLVGNAAGIVAGFAILGAAPAAAGFFTAIAVSATLVGVYNSGLAENIQTHFLTPLLNSNFLQSQSQPEPEAGELMVLAPDLSLATTNRIHSDFNGLISVVNWNPETSQVTLGTREIPFWNNEGGAAGGVGFAESSPSSIAPPAPPPDGSITISIESLNGIKEDPSPSVTVPIENAEDGYACCTSSKQDQYY